MMTTNCQHRLAKVKGGKILFALTPLTLKSYGHATIIDPAGHRGSFWGLPQHGYGIPRQTLARKKYKTSENRKHGGVLV